MGQEQIRDNYEELAALRRDALSALKVMKMLESRYKDRMTTIRLKDGTIVSSTSEDRLKGYSALDKRIIKIGY